MPRGVCHVTQALQDGPAAQQFQQVPAPADDPPASSSIAFYQVSAPLCLVRPRSACPAAISGPSACFHIGACASRMA